MHESSPVINCKTCLHDGECASVCVCDCVCVCVCVRIRALKSARCAHRRACVCVYQARHVRAHTPSLSLRSAAREPGSGRACSSQIWLLSPAIAAVENGPTAPSDSWARLGQRDRAAHACGSCKQQTYMRTHTCIAPIWPGPSTGTCVCKCVNVNFYMWCVRVYVCVCMCVCVCVPCLAGQQPQPTTPVSLYLFFLLPWPHPPTLTTVPCSSSNVSFVGSNEMTSFSARITSGEVWSAPVGTSDQR